MFTPCRRRAPRHLSGLFHKYGYVRGQGFFGQTRREQRAYPQRSGRREQRSLAEKERPPGGLRRIWPGAALLGRSSIAGDTLSPSRLASGQIGRNERDRIYETDHLDSSNHENGLRRGPALPHAPGLLAALIAPKEIQRLGLPREIQPEHPLHRPQPDRGTPPPARPGDSRQASLRRQQPKSVEGSGQAHGGGRRPARVLEADHRTRRTDCRQHVVLAIVVGPQQLSAVEIDEYDQPLQKGCMARFLPSFFVLYFAAARR